MADINLLPQELKTGKDVQKTAQVLTRVVVVLVVVLIIIGGAGGGALLIMNNNLKESKTRQDELKQNIQNLESTEQKIVLVRDRIQKTQNLLTAREEYQTLTKYDQLIKSLAPTEASFVGAELSTDVKKLKLSFKNSRSLSTVLKFLSETSEYEAVTIESLTFNPFSGYDLELILF
jgi:hypothetical protein